MRGGGDARLRARGGRRDAEGGEPVDGGSADQRGGADVQLHGDEELHERGGRGGRGDSDLTFNVAQVIAHLLAWVVIAPVLDILMYAEPANKVFVQGLMSAGVNIVTTAVVGTLLCFAYSKAIPKKGSLKEED